jgi:hypothetical protein
MGYLILINVDELILRTIGIQFDGRVVETFSTSTSDPMRMHVLFMKEPEISPPNRKGRSLVKVGTTEFYVDADEIVPLRLILDQITEAIRASAAARPAKSQADAKPEPEPKS